MNARRYVSEVPAPGSRECSSARIPDTVRRITRTSCRTREQAERELAAMVAKFLSTRSVGVRSPMSELVEAWFAIAETGC